MNVILGKEVLGASSKMTLADIHVYLERNMLLKSDEYYLISNGRKLTHTTETLGNIYVVPRLLGGKGGFGSMLRAIGAQIEKTTNREACRDLSGRRLRDINEEQRLKKWVGQQSEREKEAQEKKKKKLEKLLEQPKHHFKDDVYDKERSTLPEKIEDAVLQGLEAASSGTKRKTDDTNKLPKKKPKLWLDEEISSCSSSEDEDSSNKKISDDSKSNDSNEAATEITTGSSEKEAEKIVECEKSNEEIQDTLLEVSKSN